MSSGSTERFERIGYQIMNRSPAGSTPTRSPPRSQTARSARSWPASSARRSWSPKNTVVQNREATSRVADELVEHGKLYGDEVTSLLDGVGLRKPDVDVLDEATWPAI